MDIMLGKKDKFYSILRKYGIRGYWCDREFDLSEGVTMGSICIDYNDVDSDLFTELDEVLNANSEDDTLTCIFIDDFNNVDKLHLSLALKDKIYKEV